MFSIPSEVDKISIHVWHNHDLTLYAGETVVDTITEDQPRYKAAFKAIGPWRTMGQVGEFEGYIYLRRPQLDENLRDVGIIKPITLRRRAVVGFTTRPDGTFCATIQRDDKYARTYSRKDGQRTAARLLQIIKRIAWTSQQHRTSSDRSFSHLIYELPLVCVPGCGCPDCGLDAEPMGGGRADAPIIFVSNEDNWPDFEDAADLHDAEQREKLLREALYERCRTWDKQREARIDFARKHLVVPPPTTVLAWTCPTCKFEHQHTFFGGLAECACGFRAEYDKAITAPGDLEKARELYLGWLKADIVHSIPFGAGQS